MINEFLQQLWRGLTAPFHFVAWLFFSLFDYFEHLVFHSEQSVWQFVVNWFSSRPWGALILGFPAMASATAVVGTLAYADRMSSQQVLSAYERMANQALLANDLSLAAFCLERVTDLDASDAPNAFRLAQILEGLAQPTKAMAVMRKLAPDDQVGFGPAHLWLAKKQARAQPEVGPDDIKSMEQHLKLAIAAAPDQVEARQMLAGLYMSSQRWTEAIEQLDPVVLHRPLLYAILARIHEKTGEVSKAKDTAQKGVPILQNLLSDPSGLTPERLALADLYLVLGQHEAAANLLVAVDAKQQNGQWRGALIAVYVNWFDSLAQTADLMPRQLELLEQAMQLGPNDPNVLARLERVIDENDMAAATIRRTLEAALVQGKSLAPAHLILGTSALRHGNDRAGLQHLTLAFELDPQLPAVANNLAWALANATTPDLKRAEELIEAAVKAAPQHPEIRETRGQILAKRGKVKQAILDLEFSLQSLPNRAELHATLADLYEKLGETSIALEHRKAAGR